MFLFFDTETTGLPGNWQAPITDFENWPRLVQIAWVIYDNSRNLVAEKSYIIKPQGFIIPEEAAKVHGISTEKAMKEGRILRDVLGKFSDAIDLSSYLIAHNIGFDEKICASEFLRLAMSHDMPKLERICTMRGAVDYCRIPSNYGYKWPTLTELHRLLFREDFTGAHDAGSDVRACAKCFFELADRGVIKINETQNNG